MISVPLPLLLLATAISIGSQGAAVRSGCSQDDSLVGMLPPARAVDLRFAVNDGSGCYKIASMVDGVPIEGYIRGQFLDGLADFERERRNAPEAAGVRNFTPVSTSKTHPVTPVQPAASLRDRSSTAGLKLYGLRVVLQYEEGIVRPEIARGLVSLLDREIIRVSGELGCSQDDRLVAILQSRQNYLKSTDAAEWSAGLYDGRIHVAMPDGPGSQSELHQVLTHEVVHACLTALSQSWPSWLQEGIAQKMSGTMPSASMLVQIRQLATLHSLPKLENVAQSWSRMNAQHARLAYTLALAAANILWENYAEYGIRNILKNPDRLQSITADLDRRLGL